MFRMLAGVLALVIGMGAAQADAVLVSHGISAFGDLKYQSDFKHFDYVNPDAPKGGTFRMRGQLASQTFDSLNDFILAGEPAQGLWRLYDTLLARAYDEPDAAYGLIAESVEYPTDRSWAIYNLRPEARFSDGQPITAEDVVWTLDTLKAEGNPLYRITLKDMAKAEVLGPHRVRVEFAPGVATRDLPSEIGQIAILPKHYYETVAFDRSTLTPPVGSGRFVVDAVSPGRSIRYCAQPDYWGKDLPVNVGHHNFDCVVYEYFADNTAAFEALKVGDFLFHEEFSSATWATGYDFPAVRNGWVQKLTLPDGRPSGVQGFWFNMRRPVLQDIRVREAIALMFNFEWSNATLFYGLYDRTDSFFENSAMQAEGVPEGDELAFLEQFRDRLPPEIFTEPAYVPPVSSAERLDRRALRAASDLLDEAGWVTGADGLRRNAEGRALTINFATDSGGIDRMAVPFIENLKRAGIDARFTLVDPAQMEERKKTFDYDITSARFSLTPTPAIELRTLFGSESADQPGTYNMAGVTDPVVDEIIDAAIAATSREEFETRLKALDRVLRTMHIWVPNWYRGDYWLAVWDVFGRPETGPAFDRGEDTWWFDAAKYDALIAKGALRSR